MIGPKMNIRIRKSGGVWRHHNPWKARRQLQIQFCKPKSDWNWFSSDEFGAIFNVRNAGNGPCTLKPGTSSGRVAVLWTSRSIIWRWPAEDLCRKPPGGSTFTFARCYIQSYLNLMLVSGLRHLECGELQLWTADRSQGSAHLEHCSTCQWMSEGPTVEEIAQILPLHGGIMARRWSGLFPDLRHQITLRNC